MFAQKPLIYHSINKHNRKFNANKLFLNDELFRKNDWFTMKIIAPYFLLTAIATSFLLFLNDSMNRKIYGFAILSAFLVFLFSYRYFYFNKKAKKATGYKVKGNSFINFFKWWFIPKLQKKQLKKINKHYSGLEMESLINTAQIEYDFQNRKTGITHFEAMLVAILAIVLTLVDELDIIDGLLLKMNDGKELGFESKWLLFRRTIGLVLMILTIYLFIKWQVNEGYRDKKRKLKHFIETMQLAKGLKKMSR